MKQGIGSDDSFEPESSSANITPISNLPASSTSTVYNPTSSRVIICPMPRKPTTDADQMKYGIMHSSNTQRPIRSLFTEECIEWIVRIHRGVVGNNL